MTGITSGVGNGYQAGYDGDGLRAWKQFGSTITYYVYDPDTDLPVVELTASTSTPASTTVSNINGFGADGWRSRYAPGSYPYIFQYDPMGNIVERRFNTTVGSYYARDISQFDAFGDLTDSQTSSGAVTALHDPAGFGGQWGYYTDLDFVAADSASGGGSGRAAGSRVNQTLLTHRYYDASIARFANRDPIGYDGGLNLYVYADGNPINEFDPDGTSGGGQSLWKRLLQLIFGTVHSTDYLGSASHEGEVDPDDEAIEAPLIRTPKIAAAGFRKDSVAATEGIVASSIPGVGGAGGEVALDTNALIPLAEGSVAEKAAVLSAIGNRSVVVSMQAVKEFLKKGDPSALRTAMRDLNIKMLPTAKTSTIQNLMSIGVKAGDARVVGSAIDRGIPLLTRDIRLIKKLPNDTETF